MCVCDDKRERERERERARNDDSSYEGINRQIQSHKEQFFRGLQRQEILSWSIRHEFHLKLIHFLQFNKRREEFIPLKTKKSEKKVVYIFCFSLSLSLLCSTRL